MSEDKSLYIIKSLLNGPASQLSPATLAKLRSARTLALDHQRTRTSPVLAWASSHSGFNHPLHFSKSTKMVLAIILLAGLFTGVSCWQNYSKEREISDVDIAILTDDLPIHVFLD